MSGFKQPISIVLVHGAWADGSSWNDVTGSLLSQGFNVLAAPLPLTSLSDDVAALDRVLERLDGPVVLAAHAYGGAVIAATTNERVRGLVFIAALAPDEDETVADVFYRGEPHPQAPQLAPDAHGLIWMPRDGFGTAFSHRASAERIGLCAAIQRPIAVACIQEKGSETGLAGEAVVVPYRGRGPDDQPGHPALHGRTHGGANSVGKGRPHAADQRAANCYRNDT